MATSPMATTVAATVVAMLVAGVGARADALDGNWCFGDGRHLYIDGPKILTPGGKRLNGDYRRHTFRYTVPGGEPGAGSTAFMMQLDDNTMHMTIGDPAGSAPPSPVQVWRRCKLSS